MRKKTIALIVAAGQSLRFGGDIPKQYQMLGSKSVLRHTIEAFVSHEGIDGVKVVIHPAHHDYYNEHTKGLELLPVVEGGETRQKSVEIGLASLRELEPDYVLIHDAARPHIAHEAITDVIKGLAEKKAVVPAIPVVDTLKQVEEGRVVKTVERSQLFRVQTPQGFHFTAILAAHQEFSSCPGTDDAMIAEQAGMEVRIVKGSEYNSKITTREDMQLVNTSFETRVGMGFDVHQITLAKDTLTICGIEIKAGFGLEGHSDADVGFHALVDAILGAIAEGDIGVHFSPREERWKNADSSQFVTYAMELLRAKQGRLINADITIICERPAIAPHREAMRERLQNLLGIDISRISIKATTTEKLGFTGRGEGIAAQAVVSVRLPVDGV